MISESWQNQIDAASNHCVVPSAVRERAVTSFSSKGFPSSKLEDWKYTNLTKLNAATFALEAESDSSKAAQMLSSVSIASDSIGVLVVVNGVVDFSLSQLENVPQGMRVYSLKDQSGIQSSEDRERIASRLASISPLESQSLVALNAACSHDGAAVLVDAGVTLSEPLSIVYLATSEAGTLAQYPRLLVDAQDGSRSVVIETFIGTPSIEYFTNAVAEFSVADNAKVTHYRMQSESEAAYHISSIDAVLGEKSYFETFNFAFGGSLVRNDVRVTLNGEESHATMNGLSVLNESQHVDNSTVLDHAMPNCTSHEVYKGIYGQKSRGVFSGTIIVRPDAQKTNAIQSNQALLLSRDAEIDSRPQLKIWADDVRCTHGATVGQLDDDQLFYLMARGIPRNVARDILIKGFAQGVVEQVELESMHEVLYSTLVAKLKKIPSEI